MIRTSASSIPAVPAAILATVFSAGIGIALAMAVASPAKAYDPDVEVVCWDRDDGETECSTIGELTAECEVADPEYTTEQCQGLLEGRRPLGLTDRAKDKDRTQRDDNGGKDREPHGGGNNGGGNSGSGGNSGGGSAGGGANGAGGSGPNG